MTRSSVTMVARKIRGVAAISGFRNLSRSRVLLSSSPRGVTMTEFRLQFCAGLLTFAVLKKNLRGPCGRRRLVGTARCYLALAGLKASAKACAFGVPTPVTLSQPTFVCREFEAPQRVP
jgi:hypothetical protein